MGLKHSIDGGVKLFKQVFKTAIKPDDLVRELSKPIENIQSLSDDVAEIFQKQAIDLGDKAPSPEELRKTAHNFYSAKAFNPGDPNVDFAKLGQDADAFANNVMAKFDTQAVNTTLKAAQNVDPRVLGKNVRTTLNNMVDELSANNVNLGSLDDAGMNGFADDFVARMQKTNPEFNGFHNLSDKDMTAIRGRLHEAMTRNGSTNQQADNILSRLEDNVNTRFANNAESSIPDDMQMAVRGDAPSPDADAIGTTNRTALERGAQNGIEHTQHNSGSLQTRRDQFPAERTVDDATPNNGRKNSGNDDTPTNNNDNLGENAFRAAADRLPQGLMDQAGDIQAALKNGKFFGENAQKQVNDLINDLRDNPGRISQVDGKAKTPREILQSIAEGTQPSDAQITQLKGTLDDIATGTPKEVKEGATWGIFGGKKVTAYDPYSLSAANRLMDGKDAKTTLGKVGSWIGDNKLVTGIGVVATAVTTSFALPDDSEIDRFLKRTGGGAWGIPGAMFNMAKGANSVEADNIAVTWYKGEHKFEGGLQRQLNDLLETNGSISGNAGGWLLEAVSEGYAEHLGINALQNSSDSQGRSTEPTAVALVAGLESDDPQIVALAKKKLEIENPVVQQQVKKIQDAISSNTNEQERAANEKAVSATRERYLQSGDGFSLSGGTSTTSHTTSQRMPNFPVKIDNIKATFSQFSSLNTPQMDAFVQDAFSAASTDGNNEINNVQEWNQFKGQFHDTQSKLALNLVK